jgi:cation transport regulator ChaB
MVKQSEIYNHHLNNLNLPSRARNVAKMTVNDGIKQYKDKFDRASDNNGGIY